MIRFQGVVKSFQRHEVLKGIDLIIERGHRVALIGSNGAGKTTMIRCLLGEYTREGEITVDGMDPRIERQRVLSKIGFVPQLPPPLKMPVGQLLRFAASLCHTDPARQEDVAMLISSHRLDEVASLVNRLLEMDRGKIVLDDKVADLVELSSRLSCQITLTRPEEAFAKTIGEWGFSSSDEIIWSGLVAGPDRLRFLGVISRYAALLAGIEMREASESSQDVLH